MTKQIMIRFKKQLLFLFILKYRLYKASRQYQTYMSLNSPFLLSPFFFLSFFFYLRTCLSHWAEAYNKVHSLIYCWWNRILSVSLFLFWIYIIPIFRKGRRKNSSNCAYLCRFFYGPIIWLFPSPTIPSGYNIWVTWIFLSNGLQVMECM